MTNTLRGAGVALLLVGVLVSSACSGGDPTGGSSTTPSTTTSAPTTIADPPSPSSTSAASSPTSSRTASGPKAVAKANARKVLERYFRVYDTCLNRPEKVKMSCADKVTIGTAQRNARNAISNGKAYSTKAIGKRKVLWIKPIRVDLANKPNQQPPVIPAVVFEVCYDVSEVNIVDGNGKSIVPPGRINHGRNKVSVYNYGYPDQRQWRVGLLGDPVKDPSC